MWLKEEWIGIRVECKNKIVNSEIGERRDISEVGSMTLLRVWKSCVAAPTLDSSEQGLLWARMLAIVAMWCRNRPPSGRFVNVGIVRCECEQFVSRFDFANRTFAEVCEICEKRVANIPNEDGWLKFLSDIISNLSWLEMNACKFIGCIDRYLTFRTLVSNCIFPEHSENHFVCKDEVFGGISWVSQRTQFPDLNVRDVMVGKFYDPVV